MAHGSNWSARMRIESPHPAPLSPGPDGSGLTLRTGSYPQDYPHVYTLWGQAGSGVHLGRSDEPGRIAQKLERDPDLFLVAEVNGEIVGAVLGGFDGRRAMVYHLAVAGSYRQLGIASALMEELERRLAAKGCIRSYLLVTEDNQQAIRFYENRGWKRMDLYVYGKDIAESR